MTNEPLSRRETDRRAVDLAATVAAARKAVRRQILTLAVLLVVGVVIFLRVQSSSDSSRHKADVKFEQQIVTQCLVVKGAFGQLNTFVDQQAKNLRNSLTATEQQKADGAKVYDALHFSLGACPPVPR